VLRLEEVVAGVPMGALVSRRRRRIGSQADVERVQVHVEEAQQRVHIGDEIERIQREIGEAVVLAGDDVRVELGVGRLGAVERDIKDGGAMRCGTDSRRLRGRSDGRVPGPATQTWCARPHQWHTDASRPELLVLQWNRSAAATTSRTRRVPRVSKLRHGCARSSRAHVVDTLKQIVFKGFKSRNANRSLELVTTSVVPDSTVRRTAAHVTSSQDPAVRGRAEAQDCD
jgi:hypothetical protein